VTCIFRLQICGFKPKYQSKQGINEEKTPHNQDIYVDTEATDASEHTDLHAVYTHPKDPLLPIAV
jgi:hypothetical protein